MRLFDCCDFELIEIGIVRRERGGKNQTIDKPQKREPEIDGHSYLPILKVSKRYPKAKGSGSLISFEPSVYPSVCSGRGRPGNRETRKLEGHSIGYRYLLSPEIGSSQVRENGSRQSHRYQNKNNCPSASIWYSCGKAFLCGLLILLFEIRWIGYQILIYMLATVADWNTE